MPTGWVATDQGRRWMNEAEQAQHAREAQRRARAAEQARADEAFGRKCATIARRRSLPQLTDATVRSIQEALLHRALPDRYAATPAAARWLDHCPLVEVALEWLTMAGDRDPKGGGRHGLATALLSRGGPPTWAPVLRSPQGYLGTKDLPLVLDNVANVLYLP